jgi:hypothetical protein
VLVSVSIGSIGKTAEIDCSEMVFGLCGFGNEPTL